MKKALLLTNYRISPPHPRVTAALCALEEQQVEVDVFSTVRETRFLHWFSSMLLLGFFQPWATLQNFQKMAHYDLIYILGMRQLLAALVARFHKKTVIYETLDHEPSMLFYGLKKSRMLSIFFRFPLIIKVIERVEKRIAKTCCDAVIVNSDALYHYFNGHANVLYYFSPFEKISCQNNPMNPPALLYLGAFIEEKGAQQILDLHNKLQIPLYVFGEISTDKIKMQVNDSPQIFWQQRLSIDALFEELEEHLQKRFLLGLSLTRPVSYSAKTQELNKDIDYLCLGIPIIGNYRTPTAAKIRKGCGIFFDDENTLQMMLDDRRFASTKSAQCQELYQNKFSRTHYMQKSAKLFANIDN